MMRIWMRRGPWALALWPISLLFQTLVSVRRSMYRLRLLKSTRLSVPVIVVGNIFVGGTGKTPFVIWLTESLRDAGYIPGIISRGHGVDNEQTRVVTPSSLPQHVGDEPLLLAQRTNCPVMVGRDRAAVGLAFLAAYPEVDIIISDDGLQHYALQRDVEIMLFDERGVGNGWMLPAGPLREPASRKCDFTVVNAAQVPPHLANATQMLLVGAYAEKLTDRSQRISLVALPAFVQSTENRPPRLLAAAGIGNPERFFSLLKNAGLQFDALPLPDHFDYKTSPFSNKKADIILITEKDAVKCSVFESPENLGRFWVVPVTARIDAALAGQIVERCRGSRIA
jgi:tetraacyldisaccharide 4'-kinase